MKLRLGNITVFFVFAIAWVLLMGSFGCYWYKQVKGDTETLISYNHVKIISPSGQEEDHTHIEAPSRRQTAIFQAAFGMAILSWVVLGFILTFNMLATLHMLHKISPKLSTFTKCFLPSISFVLGIMSVLIFVGLGEARKRDYCWEKYDTENCDGSEDPTSFNRISPTFKFVYDVDKGDPYDHRYGGPYTGWICVLISSALIFVGGIFSYTWAGYHGPPARRSSPTISTPSTSSTHPSSSSRPIADQIDKKPLPPTPTPTHNKIEIGNSNYV
ncbi:hypothetical protein DFA_10748 [Cavenderia fasciculata]|uniref:Transmembrane protein n=1 Tax=Cavenderia fasciculata TaxID=261658 RepID=F4QBA3_CACFS|nr:uncharacterized protein DFA_10748 [Cavenderia fasciculata]EGG14875.1 hypothetical protein DFA_10748 [Cavenderia fasciculata]|eukprot:XP_004351391.1 hypothetical protein DFA_10748 [Cavenderia fasciculata]